MTDGITPTSDAQLRATRARTLAPVEVVRHEVLAVPLAMPGTFLPYSIAYLLRDDRGGIHVVDPGSALAENRVRLRHAIDGWGGAVRSIVVTHLHSDHLGLAAELHEETGAPLVLHEAEIAAVRYESTEFGRMRADDSLDRWGVPAERRSELVALAEDRSPLPPLPDSRPLSGDVAEVAVPGTAVEAVRTPGHTAGHIVLRLPDLGVVLTGDHVLPHIHTGLGLGGSTGRNPIADYLESLRTVAAFDDLEALPGHGYRFRGLAARSAVLRDHNLRRAEQVAAALADATTPTVWEIASRVAWTAGWQNMRDFFLLSALRQTEMYLDYLTPSQEAAERLPAVSTPRR